MLLIGAASRVNAQNSDADVENAARIQFIQRALDSGESTADRWWYGWLAGYTVAGVTQSAFAWRTDDRHLRQDLGIGALTSFAGAAGQFVFPLHAGRYARSLRTTPGDTPEQRAAKAKVAEGYLEKAAAEEAFGRSWKSQASSLAVNGTAGLLTSLAFDRPARDGLVTFAIGQAISELQFFTQPRAAVRDLAAYRRQRTTLGRGDAAGAPPAWSISVSPLRFQVSYVF